MERIVNVSTIDEEFEKSQVQGGEVSDEMMHEVAKANLLMNTSLRKYLITDRGLESRQAMAEWLTDEIASQVDKHFWDPTTSRVVSRRKD